MVPGTVPGKVGLLASTEAVHVLKEKRFSIATKLPTNGYSTT